MNKIRDQRIMNFLRRQAIDVKAVKSSRIAAAIAIRNDIISLGHNQKRTHPFQAKYCKHPEAIYLHAETDAISNALNHISKRDLAKATLYIRRVKLRDKDDTEFVDGMSKPCPGCMRAIIAFGIRKVVYSTEEDGRYGVLTRSDMPINIICS
jgi:deoxycytidylate deaminase